jgi:hypothetical protein
MQLLTLDIICRRWLLDRSLPIHFYAEALFHASTAVRELSKDTLKIVNTKNIPVDATGSAVLPDDFSSDIACCLAAGEFLQPIPHNSKINPLRIHSSTTGEFTVHPDADNTNVNNSLLFGSSGVLWFWNVDSLSEFTGRYFGGNGGTNRGYKVIKEQRRIQLTGDFASGNVIFQYISNGQGVDNASQIDWQAFRAISTYIDWQKGQGATNKDSAEGRTYYNEKRLLRANLSELTIADILNTLRKAYTAGLKN